MHELAKRLIAQHPDTPRPVRLGDLVWVVGPLFGYTCFLSAAFIAIALLFRLRVGPPLLAGIAAFVIALVVVYSRFAASVGDALTKGFFTTGEVISTGPMSSRFRVSLEGHEIELNCRGTVYQLGTRFDLMIDPEKKTTLLVLGPTST